MNTERDILNLDIQAYYDAIIYHQVSDSLIGGLDSAQVLIKQQSAALNQGDRTIKVVTENSDYLQKVVKNLMDDNKSLSGWKTFWQCFSAAVGTALAFEIAIRK